MSLIAKSLKRLEEKKGSRGVFGGRGKRSFLPSGTAIYVTLVVFTVFVIVIYSFILFRNIKNEVNFSKNFSVSIERVKKNIENYRLALRREEASKGRTCEYYLTIGNLDEMFKLATEKGKVKYIGIYYVKKGDIDKGISILKEYLKSHKTDGQARAYLSLAFFKKGEYWKAISELNRIKSKNYKVYLDKAVAYELGGDLKDAIKNYDIALKTTKDPVLKSMIKAKLVVLMYAKD